MTKFDFLICNARILDGSGVPWFLGDVGIADDRIAAVGSLKDREADQVIEADGKFLSPGFVDTHVHSDLELLRNPQMASSVCQGVTSHIIGQDGISYAPASPATRQAMLEYFAGINGDAPEDVSWQSVSEYLTCLDGASAINAAYLLPHGTIRHEVMGGEDRAPSSAELAQIQSLIDQGMRDGAVGVSTGLDYVPCHYASGRELIDISRPIAPYGGVYVAHIRSYGEELQAAMDETAAVGLEAGVAVHVSHYNGKAEKLIPVVEGLRSRGVDVTFDTYPYAAGCSILSMVGLPRWVEAGGKEQTLARLRDSKVREELQAWFAQPKFPWDTLQLSFADAEGYRELEGLRISEAAQRQEKSVGNFVCDLLVATNCRAACIAHMSNRTTEDIIQLFRHPLQMGGSDGIYTGSHPHPRGYGAFARFLELVRDHETIPVELSIQHLAYHPARRFGLAKRGLISEGWFADLALFDLAKIRSAATYESGATLAQGMEWVFVNGQPVLADGRLTQARPGRGLRRGVAN